jgi:hypothetical protein
MNSKIFFIIAFWASFFSCNYKQLGCVICDTRTKKDTALYLNNRIKEISITKYKSMRATDVPFKRKQITIKYDSIGNPIEKTKSYKLSSVWRFDWGYFKRSTRIDSSSLAGEYKITEKFYSKNGVVIRDIRKIKKK